MLDRVHFGFFLYRTKNKWWIVPENDTVDEVIVVDCVQHSLHKEAITTTIPKNAEVVSIQLFLGTIKLLTSKLISYMFV
ncbi:hypothetical protein GJ496_009678 [Pomphorhynchus laevis]|nr:hypothetical protein GJ496_009678 [Pomphorhynchus laevis]